MRFWLATAPCSCGYLAGGAPLGTNLYDVALTAAAYLLTHATAAVAALTLVRLLPSAVFLALTGTLVDRLDRRLFVAASAAPARPALTAFLLLVAAPDGLVAANSLVVQRESVGATVGPLISGALVQSGNVVGAFVVTAPCFLIAAALRAGARLRPADNAEG